MAKQNRFASHQLITLLFTIWVHSSSASNSVKIYQTDCPIKITTTVFSPKTDRLKNSTTDNNSTNRIILNNGKFKRELPLITTTPSAEENVQYYQCPGTGDLYDDDYSACCKHENKCCKEDKRSPIGIGYPFNQTPQLIVICAVAVCFLMVLTIFLCCFWSICPLYNTCRVRYYHDDSSCADKLGESQINYTMPGENVPSSNTVVIAKKFDSDEVEEKIVKNGGCLIESVKFSSNKTNELAV